MTFKVHMQRDFREVRSYAQFVHVAIEAANEYEARAKAQAMIEDGGLTDVLEWENADYEILETEPANEEIEDIQPCPEGWDHVTA